MYHTIAAAEYAYKKYLQTRPHKSGGSDLFVAGYHAAFADIRAAAKKVSEMPKRESISCAQYFDKGKGEK